VQPRIQYKQPPLLFRNIGKGKFEDVSKSAGAELTRPIVARGAAYGDFDHDGDLDILISTNNGPAYLFRNDGGNRNHWLHLKLTGVQSNRSALERWSPSRARVESKRRWSIAGPATAPLRSRADVRSGQR